MASVNKVILVGNLGKDPEMRYMPNGDAITNATLATSESWKDKQTVENYVKRLEHALRMAADEPNIDKARAIADAVLVPNFK